MNSTAPMFAPLTGEEKEAAPATPANDATEEWLPILPIPEDAPRTPPRHRHGKPALWFLYKNEEGLPLFLMARFNLSDGSKEFAPLTFCRGPGGRCEMRWKGLPSPRPLYGLDRLAARPDAPVLILEGEKTADAAAKLFPDHVAITSCGGSKAAAKADWSPIKGREVIVWPDHDEPGKAYAEAVTKAASEAGAVSVLVVDIPSTFPESWDLADTPPDGADLHALLAEAVPVGGATDTAELPNDDVTIARLAALPPLEYEREREAAAKGLGISRLSVLDGMVKAARKNRDATDSGDMFQDVTPWPYPVEGVALLDNIRAAIKRFIVCNPEIANATALWVTFTWLIDRVQVAPLLVITAPEKRCGKSQLLNLIERLSRRPLVASNISPAAVFRVIEAFAPTLLLDEADTFFKENEELRGVVNSGHTRQSAYVIRTVGDDHEPKRFSTWGAKAIAGIGHLAETITDRAVVLELRRKLPHESAERLRHAEPGLFDQLRRQLARFADDAGEAVERARPSLPAELNDRAQDNWEPLLAIADYVGGHWPNTARTTALKLSGAGQDAVSLSAELLADIRDLFDSKGVDRITTADLLAGLFEDNERPWATFNRGKEMTSQQLAKRLKEYGIKSKNIRVGCGVSKGFERTDFDDAFARYLASDTVPNTRYTATKSEKPKETSGYSVADTFEQPATNQDLPLSATASASTNATQNCSGIAGKQHCSGNENLSATRKPTETLGSSGVAAKTGGDAELIPGTKWEMEL